MTNTEGNDETIVQGDGWEWAVVEIFGHRHHAGRTREEERFGTKMLRIDVPIIVMRDDENGKRLAEISGWNTHYYGGSSIFSFSLTDEASVIRANQPYEAASRVTYRPTDDGSNDGVF